ncbi:DNA polymerase III subunit beta [Candidatus Giovannonibacteria bacterium]|nr:DNA polymerase III subunit beta [Candidatus Giovannonibacteria bacterium]
MKLNCNKNELYRLISLAERSTSKNPTLPTLSSVLLKTGKNQLSVISTNLEVGFEGNLSAKVEKEGEALPPIKTLISILYSIPDEEITLENQNNNLKITSKTSTSKIKCLSVEEFPVIPKIKKEKFFSIHQDDLTQALKNTIPAASLTHTKPELASIYIYSQGKFPITFVATDSFRLSEHKTSLNFPSLSILLPQKSAQEITRIFEDSAGDIDVIFNNNQIVFQNRNISFLSRLTEGSFPEYQTIIPKSFETQVVVEKNSILGSTRAAGVFSSKLSEITLSVKAEEGNLIVKSSSPDTGEYEAISTAKISGQDVEANFNYHYLLEALQLISGPKVFLGFNGAQKAVLVKGMDESGYIHLVMPMRGV